MMNYEIASGLKSLAMTVKSRTKPSNSLMFNRENINGFTLIEMMIAVLLSSILVVFIYQFFDYQQKSYNLQDQLTEMQQNLRVATDALSRDLRITGYGVPSATSPSTIIRITNATENSITFLANRSDVHTELSSDYASGTVLSVNSSVDFGIGKTIYITDGAKWSQATISSTATGSLTVTSALSSTYPAGSTIHVVNTVTYTIDTTDKELTREIDGGGNDPVCNNLDYLQFKYYDGSNVSIPDPLPSPYTGVNLLDTTQIRSIGILLVGRTSKTEKGYTSSGNYDTGIPYPSNELNYHRTRLETDVMLRNLAD
ncbi:MAG: hypothetical protein A3C43_07210 [Candidatus Schekmanbacteria bacterium RIFCSPHIGHO2_02_FULL_38_11]|uniref:Prepilin-type N-terminal cleavage/methylation domain-containing protein n=1 Tax=Candidatus Schekmanbacteria bacterium RIFCSPLOWO2_12_FULL_38_15 TaxID=1817883 RepID=A0A1F7SLW7_9BACT|nr:MAG: hypothetical protein A2043_08700 [Candidatus Schekmanbacteria bacterium GWA2_38_9]OGL51253.1 MAG: hypothetical protein A3H37_10590 [Candidatus Schekmanbacteria bacterium RIFCSPLOWO2_02_FULL_38_14]OGL53671.1 MAG: hypothetical protein A3C43_07210 [Candidatus Schekmanbacteria bacterium RIFCSPHIGHO2_02_FULL_38_11]OGL54204.1 MAG: hypothetical protein A3G31_05430 [Candidatus Schekmanbacteria bacterium RIFCSPLOWO2_12_FULL_38_15]